MGYSTHSLLRVLLVVVLITGTQGQWSYDFTLPYSNDVHEVSFSPDGLYIVVASNDQNHCVVKISNQNNQFCYPSAPSPAFTAKFSPNQKYLAFGFQNSRVNIRNATDHPSYPQIINLSVPFGQVQEVHFSADSTKLIVCGDNGFRIYNVPGWTEVAATGTNIDFGHPVVSCRFAPDGKYAIGTYEGQIHIYGGASSWSYFTDGSAYIYGVDFSPDSNYLLTGWASSSTRAMVFSVGSNSSGVMAYSGDSVYAVDWNQDGSVIGFAMEAANARIHNGTVGQFTLSVDVLTQPTDIMYSIDFSYNSERLVVGGKPSKIHFYNGPPSASNVANTTNATATPSGNISPQQFCPTGYYQNNTDTCRFCALDLPGCRKCTSTPSCLQCTDQYHLTSSSTCQLCISVLPGCQQCLNSTVCLACIGEYYLDGGDCLPCFTQMDGCLSCLNSTHCLECALNTHFLNSSTNSSTCFPCQALSPHCFSCNSSHCLQCQETYFFNGFECYSCPIECSSCNSSTVCTACDIGYYLLSSSCQACPSSCEECTSASVCSSCKVGFYLNGSACQPCDESCSRCSTLLTCSQCISGYFLSTSSCLPCQSSCLTCTSSASCSSCQPGHFFNTSTSTCSHCSSSISGCLSCDNATCWLCAADYLLANGSCHQCGDVYGQCQICNSSGCLECREGYYQSGGACLACLAPCSTCSSNSSCLSCQNGYYFDGTASCLLCPCPSCTSPSDCLSCPPTHYLNLGSCVDCSQLHPSCLTCSSNSTCTICASPFTASNGTCSSCPIGCTTCNDTVCFSCGPSYYYSSGACLECPDGCETCADNGNCSGCSVGHFWDNYTCTQCQAGCQQCNSTLCFSCNQLQGYVMTNGSCSSCQSSIPFCQQCLNSSVCLQCLPSYTISLSSCLPCSQLIPFCQTCSNSSYCDLCTNGFYPLNASCLPCPEGCLLCSSYSTCLQCMDEYWLNGTGVCHVCASNLTGCDRCSSLGVCTGCMFGFYLDSSVCHPCLTPLPGCLSCSNSTLCQACEAGFYLQPTSILQCLPCSTNLTGCAFCSSSSICTLCHSGYTLNSSSLTCQLCADPFCQHCNSTLCMDCLSGYYIDTNSSCSECSSLFVGCLFCNSSQCLICNSGYHLANGSCGVCPDANCQLCNSTNSSQCLHCNTGYSISLAGTCQACHSSIPHCDVCSSLSICLTCHQGYHLLNSTTCQPCSQPLPFCLTCSSSSICSSCNNGHLLLNNTCHSCSTFMAGCSFCTVQSVCEHCMQGYYLNSSSQLCERCSEMPGCLTCRNQQLCYLCDFGYYLSNNTCQTCSSALTGCIGCSSSTVCQICQGNLILSQDGCVQPLSSSGQFQQFSLITTYIDQNTLAHTLRIRGDSFSISEIDLREYTEIGLIEESGIVVVLAINSFQWGREGKYITFYTNNPFEFTVVEGSLVKMKLFSVRLLQYNTNIRDGPVKDGYHLDSSYPSLSSRMLSTNLQINANTTISMQNPALKSILPSSTHSSLSLAYNINRPEFIASTLKLLPFYYHIFGIVVTIYMFLFYLVRSLWWNPRGKDRGELAAHVLLVKSAALMVYPSYAEMVDYCWGFMVADLPWTNQYFGQKLAQVAEVSPYPYLLYYNSLSLASTYLLPLLVLTLIALALLFTLYLKPTWKPTIVNFSIFLYTFFLAGVALASVLSLQGALLNVVSYYTTKSTFYLLGIVIFVFLLIEALHSSYKNIRDIYKIRIIAKASIISVMHYNALYLFSLVLAFQVFFISFQYKMVKKKHERLWLASHVLVNLGLALLVWFSQSLAAIYITSVLIVIALLLEIIIVRRQYEESRAGKNGKDEKIVNTETEENVAVEYSPQKVFNRLQKISQYDSHLHESTHSMALANQPKQLNQPHQHQQVVYKTMNDNLAGSMWYGKKRRVRKELIKKEEEMSEELDIIDEFVLGKNEVIQLVEDSESKDNDQNQGQKSQCKESYEREEQFGWGSLPVQSELKVDNDIKIEAQPRIGNKQPNRTIQNLNFELQSQFSL